MSVQSSAKIAPLLPDAPLARFAAGDGTDAWRWLGAHADARGCRFAVWAPRAKAVELIGDFNDWQAGTDPLAPVGQGVWACYLPGAEPGQRYKFRLRGARGRWLEKADPFARAAELRPGNASRIAPAPAHVWGDAEWLRRRAAIDWRAEPLSIYEVHLGSWRRPDDGRLFCGYRELAVPLAGYALAQGFTHIELLPITEHPFDGSWGYQTTGYYAPTSRHGSADDLRWFVDQMHQRGLGVILDWSAAHFPRDAHALARFDGAPLFEHADPHRGQHPDWKSLVFDYGKPEVRSFLIGSALYWASEFHFDGLRVDACASMLYLDYSRPKGQWTPNEHGGKENLEAIAFLQQLNQALHQQQPGVLSFAEESTAWPAVTRPPWLGGLGFDFKWNMGWMHDSLAYLKLDPILRSYHHDRATFPSLYAHTEAWALPLSHDEVVHGKRPLLNKLHPAFAPDLADAEQARFANLRLLLAWQWLWPGKKLLFMGGEFGALREWDHLGSLDWSLPSQPGHAGISRLVVDLNALYRQEPALHARETTPDGFEWLDHRDAPHSVMSWLRCGPDDFCVVVLNATPVTRRGYRIGLPRAGSYRERLNSDSAHYGGGDLGNAGVVIAEARPWHGRRYSAELTLPPLSVLVLKPD